MKFLREVAGVQRRCVLVEAHAQQLCYGDLWRFMGFMDRLRMFKKNNPHKPPNVIGVYNSRTLTSPKHNLLTTGWLFSQVKMAFNFGGTGTGAGSGGGFSFGTPSTTTAGSGTTGTTGFSFGTPAANKTPASGTGLCYDRTLPDISWPLFCSRMRTSITLRYGLGIRHAFDVKK